VHAADIAEVFAAMLVVPRDLIHARAFNVGIEQNNVTVAEIANEVVEAVPGSRLVITGEAGADPRSYRVDFSRLRAVLAGHEPQWTVKAGAVELAAAYQRFGLSQRDFDHRFARLKRLTARRGAGSLDETLRPRVRESGR
jgi:nucleoside-diphosphate-sugar epimerase